MNNKIQKHEVMDLLLRTCPSYQLRWAAHKEDAGYNDGEEQLLYLDFSDFSFHLIELFKSNKTDEFPQVFQVIELLHTDGDDYVKEAVTIGLLEDIYLEKGSEGLIPFLLPVSLHWWNKLNDFWTKGKIMTDD